MRSLGRLLRISLAPSAAADVAAGLILGGAGVWPGGAAPWLLILASLAVYHGGLALNDWADRVADARARPERPIPSGAIGPVTALAIAAVLLIGGPLCAASVEPRVGAWMAAVAALAVLYDVAGRGPWLGPLLLGLCRFGNFAAGVVAAAWLAGGTPDARAFAPPLLYGAYVFAVSKLGRLEDGEDPRPLGYRPTTALVGASVVMLSLPLTGLGSEGAVRVELVSTVLVILGAAPLLAAAFSRQAWDRARVMQCMGLALRRLLVFTAAATALALETGPAAWWVTIAILCGYPVSYGLRRAFPPS